MTGYMTKVRLKFDGLAGRSPEYAAHQMVHDLFGEVTERPFIYRAGRLDERGADALVVSTIPPVDDAATISSAVGTVAEFKTKPFTSEPALGRAFDFSIEVNATSTAIRTGKRHDIWDAACRKADGTTPEMKDVYGPWLAERLAAGAKVQRIGVTGRRRVRVWRKPRGRPMTFVVAEMIGTLSVTDPSAFSDLLVRGIGRGKAFGFGMLMLTPPGTHLPRG